MPKYDLSNLLEWRCIGPFRGGRVVTVAGDPTDPATFYFGAVAGGVWKTTDAGMYWENISDGYFKTGSVGALAVSEADPNVMYAGMGETTIRIDVSTGDGLYKSTDGGESWQHVGLEKTRSIAKIAIHPHNPDHLYVAAFGHPFGPNPERGVYRSTDGGQNWELVLFESEQAGAIDLKIDPNNPRILYAATWEAYRSFWDISSGGPGSKLYKSTDGGDSWTDITQSKGLPTGPLGKMAVAVSPAKPGRVWALIEAQDEGLYLSDDGGKSWEHVCKERKLVERAWYYMHLTADPSDADTIYVNNLGFYKSTNAGHTFETIDTPHGDNHDLWIDPQNSRRMIQANDGGANVSFNGGASWSSIYNQPTAQFYRIETDNATPYNVYGTQQDNSSIRVPSRSDLDVIPWAECRITGTGESGYIAPHPNNPNVGFVGAIGSSPGNGNALQRYDLETGQVRLVSTWPISNEGWGAKADKYRFAWTYPILFSPHDSNLLYAGGNIVFKTTDEGNSWQPISPDLTRAEPHTLEPSGGVVNQDALGAEHYATVFALMESPHEPGVLWAGSDDGLLHITKDGGTNWTDVSPPDMQKWTQIHTIEPSPFADQKGTVYVAGTRYKTDDYTPYLWKTADYGETWTSITSGIDPEHFTRVIRADPGRAGLLYCGTEFGLYLSYDDGESWERFQLNLPITPIYDLKVKNNDLIAGTHGRAFWILDDLTPLHQINEEILSSEAHLFTPRTTVKQKPYWFEGWVGGKPGKNYGMGFGESTAYYEEKQEDGSVKRKFLDGGANPPDGVIISYYLQDQPEDGEVELAFTDADGNIVRTVKPKPAKPTHGENGDKGAVQKAVDEWKEKTDGKQYLSLKNGINRFEWDLRAEEGTIVKTKEKLAVKPRGPRVPPGQYGARLTINGESQMVPIEIVKDPRVKTDAADLQAQYDLLLAIRDKIGAGNDAINRIRRLRGQLESWAKRTDGHAAHKQISTLADTTKAKLTEIEERFIKPGLTAEWELFNHGVRLLDQLGGLVPIVASADYGPTTQSVEAFNELSGQVDAELGKLDEVIRTDVAAFNSLIRENGIDALTV